jgi:hypothetical protein
MRISLFKSFLLVALLGVGATGSCFAQCSLNVLAATESGDGVVHIFPDGINAFALFTTNTGGAACTVSSSPIPLVVGSVSTPSNLSATICQTNEQNAQCVNPVTPTSTVSVPYFVAQNATYSIFLAVNGTVADNAEVCVFFVDQHNGAPAGQTCVPVVNMVRIRDQ